MKIGIIGAGGKAGSRIAKEAKLRRHDVTAIVLSKSLVSGTDYPVIEKDLFDLTVDDLKGFDVVVDAFGTSFDEKSAPLHQKSLKHLSTIMEQLPQIRLMVVGGAASLYTDFTRKHFVLENIPDEYKAVPTNQKIALTELKKSSCKWTFFSPAPTFDAAGPRTGKYKLGTDYMIFNSEKEAYLSYEDYAVAMVDEIENGNFIRKRFTAVSEKTPNKNGYFGIANEKPVFEGLSTYRPQFNYELSGECFHILMDNTGDILVNFLNGTMLEYSQDDGTYTEPYQCAKGAELVYFVNFELKDSKPRRNITLIIDMASRLVTVVNTFTRYSERFPYLCECKYDFGAIDMPGFALPKKRHGYTTDLIGKRILWHYSPDFSIIHVYYHPHYARATFDPESAGRMQRSPEMEESFRANPYDETATYVKIREGLYVVSFCEQSMSRRGRTGNSLLFLMDTDRLHDVGRSFGHAGQDTGNIVGENYLFGAYGEFVTANGDEEMDHNPPFYTV